MFTVFVVFILSYLIFFFVAFLTGTIFPDDTDATFIMNSICLLISVIITCTFIICNKIDSINKKK